MSFRLLCQQQVRVCRFRGPLSRTVQVSSGCSDDVTVLGRTYQADEMTNITPNILSKVNRNLHRLPPHPLNLIKRRIEQYFEKTFHKSNPSATPIFTCLDNVDPVVTVGQNFDNLLVAKDHVSRRRQDNFYINSNHLLRAHTSAHQQDTIRMGLDAFLLTGDVFRRDSVDQTHYPVFHQMEGVRLFSSGELFPSTVQPPRLFEKGLETPERQDVHRLEVTLKVEEQLKQTLTGLVRHLFGPDIKTEWASEFFPFTHPSWELNVYFNNKWLEVLGCGVIRQAILNEAGAGEKIGWAFGLGLERLAMVLYDIPDIRLFWTEDNRFHQQFEPARDDVNAAITFTPYSKYPSTYQDVSFWTPAGKDFNGENEIMEIVRNHAGDWVEEVKLVDYFENPKCSPGDKKFSSYCYRILYRAIDKTLVTEEVNEVQGKIRQTMQECLDIQLR